MPILMATCLISKGRIYTRAQCQNPSSSHSDSDLVLGEYCLCWPGPPQDLNAGGVVNPSEYLGLGNGATCGDQQ